VAKGKRDYQAEYRRRLDRGRARGLTRSQARGHARAQEASLKAKAVKSDELLERALRELRRTNNQAIAAKEAGVSPERFRRLASRSLRAGSAPTLPTSERQSTVRGSLAWPWSGRYGATAGQTTCESC